MGLGIAAVKESLFPAHSRISNMLLRFPVLIYLIPEKSVLHFEHVTLRALGAIEQMET